MASVGVLNTREPPGRLGPILRLPSRANNLTRSRPVTEERRAERSRQVASRVDEPDVRERLWEVAEQPAGVRLVLFAQQADVVADRQQRLERPLGVVEPVEQGIVVG